MTGINPATITDWLKLELDKKLAALPDDRARVRCLAQQYGVWTLRRQMFFISDGESEVPHPNYGRMTATDFLLVLGMIDRAKNNLEKLEIA